MIIIPDNEYKYIMEIPREDILALPDEDTLVAPLAIAGYAIAHPYVAAGAVAATAFIVSAVAKWKEKIARKKYDLPTQPQLNVEPFIDLETKESKLKFTVSGSYPGRRILLKMGKGKFYGLLEPVVADRKGDGEIIVDGDLLLQIAKDKKIIDIGVPQLVPGDKLIYMYAQEVRPLLGDLRSPITPIKIEVKGIVEEIKEKVEVEYEAITPEAAATRAVEGKLSFLKFWLPVLSTLPGLPYTPGMWVPFGFIITKKP